jgi:hypothetical protein
MLAVGYLNGPLSDLGDALDTLKKCNADCNKTGGCTAAFNCTKALKEIMSTPSTPENLDAAIKTLLFDPRGSVCFSGFCIGTLSDLAEMQEVASLTVMLRSDADELAGLTAFTVMLDRPFPWTVEKTVLNGITGLQISLTKLTTGADKDTLAALADPIAQAILALKPLANTGTPDVRRRAGEVLVQLAPFAQAPTVPTTPVTPPPPPGPKPRVEVPRAATPPSSPAPRRIGAIIVAVTAIAALGAVTALAWRIRKEPVTRAVTRSPTRRMRPARAAT